MRPYTYVLVYMNVDHMTMRQLYQYHIYIYISVFLNIISLARSASDYVIAIMF
jgi:hypothetical protein